MQKECHSCGKSAVEVGRIEKGLCFICRVKNSPNRHKTIYKAKRRTTAKINILTDELTRKCAFLEKLENLDGGVINAK